jgi:hypothetical protein
MLLQWAAESSGHLWAWGMDLCNVASSSGDNIKQTVIIHQHVELSRVACEFAMRASFLFQNRR